MHFISNIFVPVLLSSTGVVASPAPRAVPSTGLGRIPVPGAPGHFMQSFTPGEAVVDTSISTDREASHGLQKRAHAACYPNRLTARRMQDILLDDCKTLVQRLQRSTASHVLHTRQQIEFTTDQQRCKVVLRNQSTCEVTRVYETAVGIAAGETLNRCSSPSERSGWGFIGNPTTSQLIYILEPYDLPPPTYSPACHRDL